VAWFRFHGRVHGYAVLSEFQGDAYPVDCQWSGDVVAPQEVHSLPRGLTDLVWTVLHCVVGRYRPAQLTEWFKGRTSNKCFLPCHSFTWPITETASAAVYGRCYTHIPGTVRACACVYTVIKSSQKSPVIIVAVLFSYISYYNVCLLRTTVESSRIAADGMCTTHTLCCFSWITSAVQKF